MYACIHIYIHTNHSMPTEALANARASEERAAMWTDTSWSVFSHSSRSTCIYIHTYIHIHYISDTHRQTRTHTDTHKHTSQAPSYHKNKNLPRARAHSHPLWYCFLPPSLTPSLPPALPPSQHLRLHSAPKPRNRRICVRLPPRAPRTACMQCLGNGQQPEYPSPLPGILKVTISEFFDITCVCICKDG